MPDRYERDRRERDEAFGDAVYDAWRRGLDSDQVTREGIDDVYYQCYDRQQAAEIEVDRVAKEQARRREQAQHEEFAEEEFPEEFPNA